ncbi:MAG: M13-type metalloendopeptidase [Chitinophagales bacterium]
MSGEQYASGVHENAQILSDPHSPAKYRVNGVLSNLADLHKAFKVKPGDDMYNPEEERAKMW